MYDYLIIGSGLFGSVFARQAADAGKKVLVIDKRPIHCRKCLHRKSRGHQFPQIRCPYFPYKQHRGMELCKPFCNVQPFYEFTGCKLQRGIVFHAF